MNNVDKALERLLRSASQVEDDEATEVPFGFATRVVAQWRGGGMPVNGNGIARLVRRVALVAAVIIVLSAAGAAREFSQTRELGEPSTNEFAIADSLINEEVSQ